MHYSYTVQRHSFCWHARPWLCLEDFCAGLCLRGIMGCCSHVTVLISGRRKKETKEGGKIWESSNEQQIIHSLIRPITVLFSSLLQVPGGQRVQQWHLLRANKAGTAKTAAWTREHMKRALTSQQVQEHRLHSSTMYMQVHFRTFVLTKNRKK